MRAFFAVDLPESLSDAIADAQRPLVEAPGIDPVDPDDAHVTLQFLGEIDDDGDAADRNAADRNDEGNEDADRVALDDVIAAGERAVERADIGPFECHVRGYGVFPHLGYVSVVWAGIDEGAAELARLHEALEAETTALGVDPENHEFTPHVTVARMRDARGKERVQDVVREGDPDVGRFEATEIRLVESTLTPDGPVYGTVETFAL